MVADPGREEDFAWHEPRGTCAGVFFWCHVAIDLLGIICIGVKTKWKKSRDVASEHMSSQQILCIPAQIDAFVELSGELQALVCRFQTLSTKDISALQQNLDLLAQTLEKARAAGMPEGELAVAQRQRRKVHNIVQDLKGSIRVFCRIRPLNHEERALGEHEILQTPDDMTVRLDDGPTFHFDAVFSSNTQENVFDECKDLIQSVIDGYSVALFSYGQTGAGKTYTMYGDPCHEGIGPRAINELFDHMRAVEARIGFTVTARLLEVYQGAVTDMSPSGLGQPVPSLKQTVRSEELCHASTVITTAEQLLAFLVHGQNLRKTCSTAMNAQSSRSHLVFIVEVVSIDNETGQKACGKLLLCDLAGSERLKKSKVTGEHVKEALEVNKSLTALFDVLEALSKRGPPKVIPYRHSKLTQVLKDCLGGTSKTVMFVNCSPAASSRSETLMSLTHAARAKKITNTPSRHRL